MATGIEYAPRQHEIARAVDDDRALMRGRFVRPADVVIETIAELESDPDGSADA